MNDRAKIMDALKEKIRAFSKRFYRGSFTEPSDGNYASLLFSKDSDLFGAIDFLYSFHISGLLTEMTTAGSRQAWAHRILSFQDSEGWFVSFDSQNHSVFHSTAYALGALRILGFTDGKDYLSELKPFFGLKKLINIFPANELPPFDLDFMEKIHFWRGSHKAGGIPAIVGQLSDVSGLAENLLGIKAPHDWLNHWIKHYIDRLDPLTGVWVLVPQPVDLLFGLLYRLKHSPGIGKIGGAVHLYWIFDKMGIKFPYPAQLSRYTLDQNLNGGLYEKYPYCIDFDGNFLLCRSYRFLDEKETRLKRRIFKSLRMNRTAVLDYLLKRKTDDWYPRAHALPGAIAAIAEAELIIEDEANRLWNDVFELVWWL